MRAKAYTEKLLTEGKASSLTDILLAKEERAEMQQELLKEGKCLISFGLNIPGAIKNDKLFTQAFHEGSRRIQQQLRFKGCQQLRYESISTAAGEQCFFVVDEDALTVKKWMVQIETDSKLGRLLDIDVLCPDGSKISRSDISIEARRCYLCGEAAAVCGRSRRHSYEELLEACVRIIMDELDQAFMDKVAANAARALLYEVATTPKPGLVDCNNSGSHSDMDIFTFIDSTAVLTPYFRSFVEKGMDYAEMQPESVLPLLRYPGLKAEDAMYCITKGINCHKGIIFSMGLVCTAVGMLYAQGKTMKTPDILSLSGEICSSLMDDFKNMKEPRSYGEKLYAQYGISGIRGEACSGYPSVENIALPALKSYVEQGMTLSDAGAWTLINLLSATEDSNIITRSDIETLKEVKARASEILAKRDFSKEILVDLDRKFIEKNISPGGCADLLALTYFLYFMEVMTTPKRGGMTRGL